MKCLLDLPVEVLDMITEYLWSRHGTDLLNVAMTCKTLSPKALELLYKNVTIEGDTAATWALVVRLLEAPNLAEQVQILDVVLTGRERPVPYYLGPTGPFGSCDKRLCDEPWLSECRLGDRWLGERRFDEQNAALWRTGFAHGGLTFFAAAVAYSCKNITKMAIPTALISEHFENWSFFPSDEWPWKSLQHLSLLVDPAHPKAFDRAPKLCMQLMTSLHATNMQLPCFEYYNVEIEDEESLRLINEGSRFDVSKLSLLDAWNIIPMGRNNIVNTLLESCMALKEFQLEFNGVVLSGEQPGVDHIIHELRRHKTSLTSLRLSYVFASLYESDNASSDDASSDEQEMMLYPQQIVDLSEFSSLTHLGISICWLFGLALVEFKSLGNVTREFGKIMKYSLVDRLPTSLETIELTDYDHCFVEIVMRYALQGLLEHRAQQLPFLRRISITTRHSVLVQKVLKSPEGIAAQADGVQILLKSVLSSGCPNEW